MGYFSQGDTIEVYVSDHLGKEEAFSLLKQLTSYGEEKFHIILVAEEPYSVNCETDDLKNLL